ncbi:MAG: alpha/beta hydrolase [Thiothrix sp.]|nr:MAG: alpha/beta hydrolase [Thiothrix sp.]
MITDWDDAYSNGAYIEHAETYPKLWADLAAQFRATAQAELNLSYGIGERERFDLFYPVDTPKGLAVFVHGGYWLAFDKSSWSHLAAGALAQGYAVALPSYPLAPQASIPEITQKISQAIHQAAQLVSGPIHLAGHSAGGHLVTRMICQDSPLATAIQTRIKSVVSISGLHDLRPLMRTTMNQKWQLSTETAVQESAALQAPLPDIPVACWVGALERPEFLRQNDLLANIWTGFGIDIRAHREAGRHHFDVVADLVDADSGLVSAWLSP